MNNPTSPYFKIRSLFVLTLLFIITLTIKAQTYQHLIIYGQSLSTGHQSWPPLSTTPVTGNYMIGTQVWTNFGNTVFNKLNPLIANVAASTVTLAKTRANMIYAEPPVIAAANHIQLKTNAQHPFIVSSCGTGGKTIEELSKEFYNPVYYANFTNAINYGSSVVSDIHCPAIIWMQGEYNYTVPSASSGLTSGSKPTADKAAYKSLLLTLKENMQSDIMKKYNQTDAPLFITYQAGAQYTRGSTLSIGMALLEASNENDDIVCAGPVYPMTDRGGHLDSNGYRWYGEMLGKVYYRTKVLGQDFKPLQPIELSRTDNPKVLKVKFFTPQPPLVLDEMLVNKVTSYGFELYLNGAKKIITGVSVDNDCVYISCISDLTGDVEVIYAGTNNAGHGNLRDSDNYPAYYNYIDLDKKNTDGSFVFARDAAETTLRPSYEPRDSEGIIYNKPYPLYNFSVAFYYKLNSGVQTYQVPNLNPNTATDQLTTTDGNSVSFSAGMLSVRTTLSGFQAIEVIDLTGKKLAAFMTKESVSGDTYTYPAPQLSKGIYLVNILSNNNISTSKLMVK